MYQDTGSGILQNSAQDTAAWATADKKQDVHVVPWGTHGSILRPRYAAAAAAAAAATVAIPGRAASTLPRCVAYTSVTLEHDQ